MRHSRCRAANCIRRTSLDAGIMRLHSTNLICGLFAVALIASPAASDAQTAAALSIAIHADQPGPIINRDIFGQFVEHLGEGVYGGIWVGQDSAIVNVRGIRSDVVNAMRALKVPVVRWPGGCFADAYQWRNGVGPAKDRPVTVNGSWGNTIEPNAFGTEEFMDFVQQIGSEAYININLGTGTPQAAADWLEYMTTGQPSSLGQQRASNGHPAPYRIKYLGIGNESWGCGGNMAADDYVRELKHYATFVRNQNPEQASPIRYIRSPNDMQRIAVGPEDEKVEYTEAVMKAWQESRPWRWGFEGLSLHHYTMGATPMSSAATGFGEADYALFVQQTLGMDALIAKHAAIMDKYDPAKKVALVVDEWGAWLKPMPGTDPRLLKQQNSLRDAVLASLDLNIFVRHADRVRMANIAQMANVLQSMVLTDHEKMLLTPTYHVFRMYVPFQDAQRIPIDIDAGSYRLGQVTLPRIDAIGARAKVGKVWIALTNIDPSQPADISASLEGVSASSAVGEVLTSARVDAVNDFSAPENVAPHPVRFNAISGKLLLHLPPKSITVIRLQP